MAGAAVELAGVTKTFGSFPAVRDLSLSVPQRSFFCLLGPSGSGKSTVLRLIAGLEAVTEGSVRIAGQEATGVPPDRRPVNTVFQSYALFPRMSAYDNVAYGLRAQRTVPKAGIKSRVTEALRLVQMTGSEGKRPSHLSGGEQQRIALARALVNRPTVLLLDEPLGALDLQLRRDMQTELVRLHKESGTTFVHVTHDQEECFACATDVAVMRRGTLEQVGTPLELYSKPRSAFVARFVGTANLVPCEVLERAEGSDRFLVRTPLGVVAAGSWLELARGGSAWLVIRPEHVQISEVEPAQASEAETEGRLRDVHFAGGLVRLHLKTCGLDLIAEQLGTSGADARPGDRVNVRLRADAAWLVPREGDIESAGDATPMSRASTPS